jgi:hypothetical protein
MSQDTDTRVVAASYKSDGTQSIAYSTGTNIVFNTKEVDTHSAFDGTFFTAPVSGIYKISASIVFVAATQAEIPFSVDVIKSGSTYLTSSIPDSLASQKSSSLGDKNSGTITCEVQLNSGQTIRLRATHFARTGVPSNISATVSNSSISIHRLSGPATIAAIESVGCSYFQTAALTPGDSYVNRTIARYTTKRFDTHGVYNTSTGIATIPVSGKYYVKAQLLLDRTSGSVADAVGVVIRKNSGDIFEHSARILTTTANNESPCASGLVDLNAGDTISVYCYVVGISGRANLANTLMNSFDLVRVGN